jgi:hypothetical protein
MTIQTHFNKFDKAIYLTNQSADYKKAKEKDKSILELSFGSTNQPHAVGL